MTPESPCPLRTRLVAIWRLVIAVCWRWSTLFIPMEPSLGLSWNCNAHRVNRAEWKVLGSTPWKLG